jgi:YD repeat-containing protein
MLCFEHAFHVPSDHSLEQVKTRSRGGVMMEVHWEHREYSADGHFVARYESYQVLDSADRVQRNSWYKYDQEGHLINQGHFFKSANRSDPLDKA